MSKLQFSHKLIILSSLLLVLALSASALNSYFLLKEQTQQSLTTAINQLSTTISENIADWLNAKANITNSMAIAASDDMSKEALRKVLKQGLRTGDLKNTFIGTEDKRFIVDDESVELPSDYDPRTRPWYQLARQNGKNAFTPPYLDASTNQYVISIATPIYQNNNMVGAAGLDIHLSELIDIINRVNYLDLGYAFLVSEDGSILSHPNKTWVGKNVKDIFKQAVPLKSQLTTYQQDGAPRLAAFYHIKNLTAVKWYLGVVLEKDKAYAATQALKLQSAMYGFISIVMTVLLMSLLLNFLMRPIRHLSSAIKDISHGEGDLTQRLKYQNQDEIGELSEHFNHFIKKIHQSMQDVNTAAEMLKKNIQQVGEVTELTKSLFIQQNSLTSNVNQAIHQLNTASNEISANAQRASSLASDIHQLSVHSRQVLGSNINNVQQLAKNVEHSGERIKELNNSTENIGDILSVIKSVSEQTNLLSLNAAIEAARAGEQGRGFAVVADEVRQLAHRTSDSTSEINEMIQGLQQGVYSVGQSMIESASQSDVCVSTAEDAGSKMDEIMQASTKIDGENQSVAAATEEQNHVIDNINKDIITLTGLTEKGAVNLNRITQECEQLKNQFTELDKLVSQFKI
ncbi:methyl-accepting chemotaxis protein [Aliikangiella maris]|uniref:Methyl-accepting chemotaxis protein n=2 Tax=Aliikangiella maris TaxID=3162458 RepID=A0ABV3MPZ9_9GAMM